MYSHALQPSGIGFHHFELDPSRAGDQLATNRHSPRERDDQASDRVDILGGVAAGQIDAQHGRNLGELGARAGDKGAIIDARNERALLVVVLVLDLSDHDLDQSSIETSPSVPPYSSMTSAIWVRVACMRRNSATARIDAGT